MSLHTDPSVMNQIAKDAARREKEQQKQMCANQLAYERAHRESIRLKAQEDKDAKLRYLESRIGETEEKNKLLSESINEINGILQHTLHVDDMISFDSLRIKDQFRDFTLPPDVFCKIKTDHPG
jgi:restriction system protein